MESSEVGAALRHGAPRRILLVAEYYPSGGTRTYLKQLLNFYARMGAEVVLVTTLPEPDPEIAELALVSGVEMLSYHQVLGKDATLKPSVWSLGAFLRERAAFRELALSLGMTTIVVSAGTPGYLLGALNATPGGIYILHTYPHGRRQELLARPYLSHLVPRNAFLVSVSEFEKRALERLWRTGRRGIAVSTLLNTCGESEALSPRATRPLQVLTVAMVEEYKQPLSWVRVATEVSREIGRENVRFVWLGDGQLLGAAREAADSVRDLADIRFPGRSSNPEFEYLQSRIYFQYSSIENMSLAVIDAMKHGLPSVVTDVGGLPEIIQDGQNGFIIPPGNDSAAVKAILLLLRDNEVWREQGANASSAYLARHSPQTWEQGLMKIHGWDSLTT